MQVIDFDEEVITFLDSQGGIFYETIYQKLRYVYIYSNYNNYIYIHNAESLWLNFSSTEMI